MQRIDFRSDTVTQPTKEMLAAMMAANVGDDVFEEDPTAIELEHKLSTMFGQEAGLFCASGVMANQIAIAVVCNKGDEVICSNLAHIYHYEGGGIAANAGASVRLVNGNRGQFTSQTLQDNINPDDPHFPISKMVALENTCNKGGGAIWAYEDIAAISKTAKAHNLHMHLDGARVFNAIVAADYSSEKMGTHFQSISICLSKGLGCPVGSVLLGSKSFIARAKRIRKIMGGAMRQVGYLAAAGIYALDNHTERLSMDQQRATAIGKLLEDCSFITEVLPVETNIVVAKVADEYGTDKLLAQLHDSQILAVPFGKGAVRFVTHLGIDDESLLKLSQTLTRLN